MKRAQPISTRTDTLCPSTTLLRADSLRPQPARQHRRSGRPRDRAARSPHRDDGALDDRPADRPEQPARLRRQPGGVGGAGCDKGDRRALLRSEEHTSELQSLMRISYAVFCLKKKKKKQIEKKKHRH